MPVALPALMAQALDLPALTLMPALGVGAMNSERSPSTVALVAVPSLPPLPGPDGC